MWPWVMIIAGLLLIVAALIARARMMRAYQRDLDALSAQEPPADKPVDERAEHADSVDTDSVDEDSTGETPPVQPAAIAEPTPVLPEPVTPPAPQPSIRAVRASDVPIILVPTGTPKPADPEPAPAEPEAEPEAEDTAPQTSEPEAPRPVLPPRPAFARAAPPAATPATPAPAATAAATSPSTRAPAAATVPTEPSLLFADLPVDHLLSAAPTLRVRAQDIPLQDWLRYYSEGNAWSGVIQSISDRIRGDQELRPWFGFMDRTELQRHVMTTVMMLTGEGVTVGALRRFAGAHLDHVRGGGEPLTEQAWDRLAATLANAMREHSVPESAVQDLEVTAAPLRSVIVAR